MKLENGMVCAILAGLVMATAMAYPNPSKARTQNGRAISIDASALASDQDASVRINETIREALASRFNEVDLPAGNFYLLKPIVIPEGARNFALVGAGSTSTLFHTPNPIGVTIQAGRTPLVFNNWGFAPKQSPTSQVAPVHEGDTWIQLGEHPPIVVGGHYVLYDNNQVVMSATLHQAQCNRRELVRVLSYDAQNDRVQIDVPAARDYTVGPAIAYVEPFTSENLTIRGIGIDGTAAGGKHSGGVAVGITDGVAFQDLAVVNFTSRSISCVMDRNVSITNCLSQGGERPNIPGSGYGPSYSFCRFVTVKNSVSDSCRHGFLATNGTTDVAYDSCQVTGTMGNFDSHGFDERRISYVNCVASGGLNVGNVNWLGGAKEVTASGCTFSTYVGFAANSSDIKLTNCKIGSLRLDSAANTPGVPSGGQADRVHFTNCLFSDPREVINGNGTAGQITFDRCTLEQSSPAWGSISKFVNFRASLTFNATRFITRSHGGYSPFFIDTPGEGVDLRFNGCSFESEGQAPSAVELSRNTMAHVSVVNTTFRSASPRGGQVVKNDGASSVDGG